MPTPFGPDYFISELGYTDLTEGDYLYSDDIQYEIKSMAHWQYKEK